MADTSALIELIDVRTNAENAVAAAAIAALREEMRENGWSAVEVDCEGLSNIQKVRDTKSGTWTAVDDDVADDLFTVAGNVPRNVYKWVGGEFDYTVTLAELEARAYS